MEERIRRALMMVEIYATTADHNAAHALGQAESADGAAKRLWLAECEKERARAAALRSAYTVVLAAIDDSEVA
jgi:hypothetical protein